MPRIKSVSTVAVPLWMVLLTACLFLLRVGALYYDSRPESKKNAAVAWSELKDAKIEAGHKLVLYEFTAVWCGPAKMLETVTFQDRHVAEEIKNYFIPVRVTDPDGGDKSPEALKIKRLQERFKVNVFPTLVVCRPDGLTLASNFGFFSGRTLVKFLEKARRSLGYVEGKQHFLSGQYKEAAQDFTQWSKQADWHDSQSLYGIVFGAISDRMLGRQDDARALIETAQDETASNVMQRSWPYAALGYLNGTSSAEELVKEGDRQVESDPPTDAHAIVGMNLLSQGKEKEARQAFHWVESNGNRYAYTYEWVLQELRREEKRDKQ